MTDNIMHIPEDDTQNYPFCRSQLVIEMFGHSTKWTKQSKFRITSNPSLLSQRMRKRCYKTLGTSVINTPKNKGLNVLANLIYRLALLLQKKRKKPFVNMQRTLRFYQKSEQFVCLLNKEKYKDVTKASPPPPLLNSYFT